MRLGFAILALCMFMAAPPVNAADLFVRKGPPPAAKTETTPAAPAVQPAPAPAPVPVKSVSEYAAQYYQTCTAKTDAVLKGPNLELQCACTSQKIIEQMTLDDVNAMIMQTADGEFQRNRLLLQVYAPCMQQPVHAILTERCQKDVNIQKTVPNYQQACSCMGMSMGAYVAQNGASIIAKTLRLHPGDTASPLSNLMRDPDFQARVQTALGTCMNNPSPEAGAETPEVSPPADAPIAPPTAPPAQ